MTGTVRETYHAAVQHGLVDVDDATLVGVVRRPTGWFRGTVDENYPALGPPEALLEETKARAAELKRAGLCDEEAHNAAWDEIGFDERYRAHLDDSAAAQNCLGDLAARVRDGETVALVCFEGEDKRCHRHRLVDELRSRVAE